MLFASGPFSTISNQCTAKYVTHNAKICLKTLNRQNDRETFEIQTALLISQLLIAMQTSIVVFRDATGSRLTSASCFAHMVKVINAH